MRVFTICVFLILGAGSNALAQIAPGGGYGWGCYNDGYRSLLAAGIVFDLRNSSDIPIEYVIGEGDRVIRRYQVGVGNSGHERLGDGFLEQPCKGYLVKAFSCSVKSVYEPPQWAGNVPEYGEFALTREFVEENRNDHRVIERQIVRLKNRVRRELGGARRAQELDDWLRFVKPNGVHMCAGPQIGNAIVVGSYPGGGGFALFEVSGSGGVYVFGSPHR